MSSKDELKEAGAGIGRAFKTFGKTFVRSAERVADKTGIDENPQDTVSEDGSTVFSDGSWRQVGKELGSAFLKAGSAAANAASDGIDSVTEKMDGKKSE